MKLTSVDSSFSLMALNFPYNKKLMVQVSKSVTYKIATALSLGSNSIPTWWHYEIGS